MEDRYVQDRYITQCTSVKKHKNRMKTVNFSISIVIEPPPPNRWKASLKHMMNLENGCSMISMKSSFVDRVVYNILGTYNGITAKIMKDRGKEESEVWYSKK